MKAKRETDPINPRKKASKAEDKGIYLLKMPMVPTMNKDEINIMYDLLSFVLAFTLCISSYK